MTAVPNSLIHLLNEHAVAELLGVSVATVRRWRLTGNGPKFLKLGSLVKYTPDSIASFLASLPTGGGGQKSVQIH